MRDFIRESNRIEGIKRELFLHEIEAHENIMELEELRIEDICNFVKAIAKAPLRDREGMDVSVGNHVPDYGGHQIRSKLDALLGKINIGALSPYEAHHCYESLHPFMDGNGRSGRVIWLWIMQKQLGVDAMDVIYARGFLHSWYYQSLSEAR